MFDIAKTCMQASARKHGWMKEAQLRAAASIADKRADDEAEHARQRNAAVRDQSPSQKVRHTPATNDAVFRGRCVLHAMMTELNMPDRQLHLCNNSCLYVLFMKCWPRNTQLGSCKAFR